MRFRTRVFAACMAVAVVPLVGLTIGVRREVDARLTAQYDARAAALSAATRDELANESSSIAERLASLRETLVDDNRFRLAAVQHNPADRGYLLDYAGQAMRASGLAMLQIQDDAGRILSSGHFRNEFDRLEPDLPGLIAAAPGGTALVDARSPDAPLRVMARADSLRLAGRRYTIVGGVAVNARFLQRLSPDSEFRVALADPDTVGAATSRQEQATALPFPIIVAHAGSGDSRSLATAHFVISHSGVELASLERSVDFWSAGALAVSITAALAAAIWLAGQVSGPLSRLAAETSRIDLDRMDASFSSDRTDEVGDLARLLNAMTRRLRLSTARWRDAERRATVGDLARQVAHDVKNGLVPLRHVLHHLAQVEREDPQALGTIFAERRPTLDASVEYLDALARTYARLGRPVERAPCDLNDIVRLVAATAASDDRVSIRLVQAPGRPTVLADALALRRILDNLMTNAIDAVSATGGAVTVSTAPSDGGMSVAIADTGPGMSDDEATRAQGDFYTTKPGGSGLGLSIVRRLATDMGATLQVTTGRGTGTTVTLSFPEAGPASRTGAPWR
jgi:signal transduction histidine kinase